MFSDINSIPSCVFYISCQKTWRPVFKYMHIGIIWWVFSQDNLRRKDFSQHCFEGSPYKRVYAWQLSPVETVLLTCEWHNATLADGHQCRHARELVRALSLSIRTQISIQVWVSTNLHSGWMEHAVAASAQFVITFGILKILPMLLKNTTLFSWQIRAVISKGTWVRESTLQPSTLLIFP